MHAAHPAEAIQCQINGAAFQLPAHLASFSRGGGQRLPEPVRQQMESVLGGDFSDVRVHVGPEANAIGALAFTHGSNVYFAPGQYDPHTPRGQQLLGHELTHVMQQRAGRVRNPFGSGVAVVQDHALEAEADRMGQRAAAHRIEVQAKLQASGTAPARAVRLSSPTRIGDGSFRVVAGADGRAVGSVMLHSKDRSAIEITNLAVDPGHRERGIGTLLMASAMRAGLKLGKSKVILAAQDNGSGHLIQWYKRMGFAQIGVNKLGYSQLEASITRALCGVTQAALDPSPARNSQQGLVQRAALSRSPSAALTAVPYRLRPGVVQRMDAPQDHEDICAAFIQAWRTMGKTMDQKPTWQDLAKIPFGKTNLSVELKKRQIGALKTFQEIMLASKAYAAIKSEDQQAKAQARLKVEQQEQKQLADMAFRRMETLARFLETGSKTDKGNVCVAIVELGGVIYATTNEGPIAPLGYDDDVLLVNKALTVEKEEQPVEISATKLSSFIGASDVLRTAVNKIQQIGIGWSNNLHAEMKMLDFLYVECELKGVVTIYISRLCCPKCRVAIDKWNDAKKGLMLIVRPGTHGSAYPGWDPPECIRSDDALSEAIAGSDRGRRWDTYSSRTATNIMSTRRSRSQSPRRGGKYKNV